MNEEIEVKILEIDVEDIKKKMEELNAQFLKSVFQKNYVYHNDYTNKEKILVRIRDEGEDVFITVKGPSVIEDNHKIREELEFNLKDEPKLKRMLELMGFSKKAYYEYKRQYYKLKGCVVEIIEAPKIPIFMEIEGNKEDIEGVANLLGFTKDDFFAGHIYDHYEEYTLDLRFEQNKNE
ncbi:class IV adenylate cyclase [Candidatus Woesearchaeota archaeon]|nr:class IV adenylate cyclase [Candidatus Woesearchaeota archaeon]